ncbi:uncharacterized protein At4g19900-like [Actinidia eriantha]|uniref:uncharacterized protein At4g19900-like n=1 Tax=Actinidia eriantha TaxID=165200 RepID=UPI00258A43DB|nr:uncharacterized protein At4g19900-like [Actinidia eriantha]
MDQPNYTNTKTNTTFHLLLQSLSLHHLKQSRRSLFAFFSLLLLFLLAYNAASIFCLYVPFPAEIPPEPASFLPENVSVGTKNLHSSSIKLSSTLNYALKEENPPLLPKTHLQSSQKSHKLASFSPENVAGGTKHLQSSTIKLSSTLNYTLKEENPPLIPKTHLRFPQKAHKLVLNFNDSVVFARKRRRKRKLALKFLPSEAQPNRFSTRVNEFLTSNSCEIRFFMTWISSLASFGERESLAIQSIFKSHPNGCLIIISNSMDSRRGMQILRPFSEMGFRIIPISPDFDYLFKHTMAESWFGKLKRGHIDPGGVSLGQNLSNLLRLALLYKYGGVYLDTDVIVLKSFTKLRNSIGAQTIDLETRNWSRLNNAVMVFDKNHPILSKFIEEFALTFDGNKWGHNGPYLVSRVISRLQGRHECHHLNVLNPIAFYPVDWSRIRGLFRGPRNGTHSKWLRGKLNHIRERSYAVHLWNRQSKKLVIEEGSIIGRIMRDCCVFCNSTASNL